MRKSAANDDVLSTREAAERLGVALRTVQLWVESGVLPAWKTAGGHRRISRLAVERLIEERRQALEGGAPAPDDHASGRLRLLLVEDQLEQRKLMTLVIESWEMPIDLSTATDGYEALLSMGRECPDVLITDLDMPGMDGFRMVAAVRSQGPAYADMDIAVVTALSPAEIHRRGGLPDGLRLFFKPVHYDELERVVRQRLERRKPLSTA